MKVYLIGTGPGSREHMTAAALAAIDESPVLIGAPRLLEGHGDKTCLPLIAAADIAEAVHAQKQGPISILLSGDIGFYSGAKNLYPLLADCETVPLPGLSSLPVFCAKLRTPWEDAYVVSAHGRAHNAPGAVQSHYKTFILTGGSYRPGTLCAQLTDWGLGDVRISVGERLSYSDERITTGTAAELANRPFDSLAVVLAENPAPILRPCAAPSLTDGDFLRGKTPMTKEETRALVLSKLRLRPHHTVWDVGAGTGSVSVACCLAANEGQVYAIERSTEAIELLRANRAKFALTNLHIVEGAAPEALSGLPAPDRVFLGGTGGSMEAILRVALSKNPTLRAVITAVTIETIAEAMNCFAALGFTHTDAVQLSAARTRQVGRYHLMDAQNPVWIVSGEVRHD